MITYKRELVTPQRARQFLDNNAKNNRNMRLTKVKQYARDMKNGRWDPNTGQTIKVTVEGIMLDGQNRMAAVIESGTAIYFDDLL